MIYILCIHSFRFLYSYIVYFDNPIVECNELPTKPNAYIPGSITDVNVEGYVKTYHCNINYIPSPESDSGQIICQNNGEWTESNLECLVGSSISLTLQYCKTDHCNLIYVLLIKS